MHGGMSSLLLPNTCLLTQHNQQLLNCLEEYSTGRFVKKDFTQDSYEKQYRTFQQLLQVASTKRNRFRRLMRAHTLQCEYVVTLCHGITQLNNYRLLSGADLRGDENEDNEPLIPVVGDSSDDSEYFSD
jgi:uncharacterized protein DUF6532